MRTDFIDPTTPQAPKTNPGKPKAGGGGCFSLILYLIGGVTIVVAIIGFILSFFDMVLVIQNNKLPMITLEIFIPLLVCAAIFLLLGWLVSKLEKAIQKRKQKKKGQQ